MFFSYFFEIFTRIDHGDEVCAIVYIFWIALNREILYIWTNPQKMTVLSELVIEEIVRLIFIVVSLISLTLRNLISIDIRTCSCIVPINIIISLTS